MNNWRSLPIFINGRFLSQSVTGVQRYAEEVVKGLDSLLAATPGQGRPSSITIVSPRNASRKLDLKAIRQVSGGFFNGHLWEQFSLPYLSRGGLLLSLCNTGPLVKSRHVVTIHDASVFGFPAAYSFAFRNCYRLLFWVLGRTARKVVTDSKFSKKELQRYCRIVPRKIKAIHLGSQHLREIRSDDTIMKRHDLVRGSYVLAVSSLNPNKNFQAIADAILLLGSTAFKFVIAGAGNTRVFGRAELSLPPHVTHVGYVSDEELKALYENAACFVYPSFYEGFGLPPLEAMTCGCPVIVSAAASLPEVCGEAALYCNPHDAADIAEKIRRVMTDPELRIKMRAEGIERARVFSWEKCARELWGEIEMVLAR